LTQTPTGFFLERGQKPRSAATDPDTRTETATKRQREPIRCRRCSQELSTTEALFAMQGERVERVFSNPHGFLHEVLTLSHAQALRVVGPPTTEFTWFPGYAWEMAFCDNCQSHVGWHFVAVHSEATPEQFWGLRKNAVTIGEES